MKIIINRHIPEPINHSIQDFADEHGLTMEINERSNPQFPEMRFYAHFKHVEVVDGGILISEHGNGSSPAISVAAYVSKISGKKLRLPDDNRVTAPIFDLNEIIEIPD